MAVPDYGDLLNLLHELYEDLDSYVDVVDGPEGEPRPNRAMQMQQAIERMLRAANDWEQT